LYEGRKGEAQGNREKKAKKVEASGGGVGGGGVLSGMKRKKLLDEAQTGTGRGSRNRPETKRWENLSKKTRKEKT